MPSLHLKPEEEEISRNLSHQLDVGPLKFRGNGTWHPGFSRVKKKKRKSKQKRLTQAGSRAERTSCTESQVTLLPTAKEDQPGVV